MEKQSFNIIIILGHDFGNKESKGSQGYKGPIGLTLLFTALKSIIILHLSDFILQQTQKNSMCLEALLSVEPPGALVPVTPILAFFSPLVIATALAI